MVMLVGYGESAFLVWSRVCLLSMQTPYVHGCTALVYSKRQVVMVGVGVLVLFLCWFRHMWCGYGGYVYGTGMVTPPQGSYAGMDQVFGSLCWFWVSLSALFLLCLSASCGGIPLGYTRLW